MANCPNFYPVKVSQLSRYQNIDVDDFILMIESGSQLSSRRSTVADFSKALRLVTGSYSGSFSGSFFGRVLSKNANLTGALSGSYFGSIISKNTIASGSFSGSHFGRVISKNTKASGSFKGTFYGDLYGYASGSLQGSLLSKNTVASGSFSGSHFGRVISKNTKATGSFSGSHFGSIVSKNTKASGSFSGSFFGKISKAFESDTLLQSSNQPYKFTYFNGSTLINSPYFSYDPTFQTYYISSSNSSNYFIIDSLASGTGFAQSGLILSNNYNRKNRVPSYNWGPEGWRLFSNASGSLDLASLTGSYQFKNTNFTPKGTYPYFSALRTVNNAFYFWPEPNSYNTINRDGSIGIGVQAPSLPTSPQTTKAKLHINVFSSSIANRGTGNWPGSGTVRSLDGAILVEFGSGSAVQTVKKTFYVSGSGNMYSAGTFIVEKGITGSLSGSIFGRLVSKNTKASGSFSGSVYGSLKSKNSLLTGSFRGIDNINNFKGTGKKVSFNGTASYAISSSYALTASYIIPSSGVNSINRKTIDVFAGGYGSPNYGPVAHGCTSTPFGFTLNWYCFNSDPVSGYSTGDIVNFNNVFYIASSGDNEAYVPGASVKVDSTNLTVIWPNVGWKIDWYLPVPTGGKIIRNGVFNFSPNYWKLRVTLLY